MSFHHPEASLCSCKQTYAEHLVDKKLIVQLIWCQCIVDDDATKTCHCSGVPESSWATHTHTHTHSWGETPDEMSAITRMLSINKLSPESILSIAGFLYFFNFFFLGFSLCNCPKTSAWSVRPRRQEWTAKTGTNSFLLWPVFAFIHRNHIIFLLFAVSFSYWGRSWAI